MTRGSRLLELRPNRLLLDDSFGGYKLSLDPVPIYRRPVDSAQNVFIPGVKVAQPSDDQFSFYHVKIFSLHNHLHVNPYKDNSVYFVDKNWKILKVVSSPPHESMALKEVLQIPHPQQQLAGSYNISLGFPQPEMAVVCDGSGALYLAEVKDQSNDEAWELVQADCLFHEGVNCGLCDARMEVTDGERMLHVLLLFVEEKENGVEHAKDGLFQTKLRWRTFVEKGGVWEKGFCKELCVNGSVDYVALEPSCKSLYIISDKSPKWVSDSEKPLELHSRMEVEPPTLEPKLYTWTQTSDEITIWLPVEEGMTKTDFLISVDELQLEIKVKGETIIRGKFFHRVSKDLTMWVLEKDRVEIQLTKHESGLMWKALLPDDNRGEEVLEPEVVRDIHEKLAHLCSDKQETGSTPTFNTMQLEECDAVSCDASLFRINGESHQTSHEVSLSSLQWLFKISLKAGETPGICVRHDVDACVWQFSEPEDEEGWPHKHVGTFSAFGYVQASKTQKKFMASPPDLSYVAILEASHHIYVYRQPSPLTSELKNRYTGKKVNAVSKQQLVNLETKDQILGVHATNTFLFVLLENSICALAINA